ncbi:MAG: hypothetical protein R3190_18255, partial [Thermoanaerobaculia bacterium]|nr:hypothetical protein [Thermoanaerobaculia bacterium]
PAKDPAAVEFTASVRAIREVVDIGDQATDWLNAIHFVAGEPQADVDRLGLWGSSNSGGLSVWAAAHDPRVRAVHSQVSGGLGATGLLSEEVQAEATRRARGELDYPEPRAEWGNLRGAPIRHRYATYTPGLDIRGNDAVALQFVLAEVEEYGGNPAVEKVFEQHRGPKNLVVIEGIGHYGIYREAWQQAQDLAIAWFDEHLAGAQD